MRKESRIMQIENYIDMKRNKILDLVLSLILASVATGIFVGIAQLPEWAEIICVVVLLTILFSGNGRWGGRHYTFDLSLGGMMPLKGSKKAAGYDLFVPEDTEIHLGRQVISHKIQIEMDDNVKGIIYPKSGQSVNGMKAHAVYEVNGELKEMEVRIDADVCIGTIDADYHDTGKPVGTIIDVHKLPNIEGIKKLYLPKGSTFSQIEFENVVDDSGDGKFAEERNGGFGSSTLSKKGNNSVA
jgi:dUTPase